MGLKINPGTIISIQPHALHRDPDTFPNPDVWDPERWQVPITSPAHRQMQRMLMPFGYGQRMCTGMNVAWAIMRQVTASIYREYETSLDEGVWFDADGELASKDVKHENRRRKKKNLFPDGATTNGLENPVGNCLIFIMLLVSFYLRWISGIQPSGGTDLASVFRNCAKPSERPSDVRSAMRGVGKQALQ
ncbi:hypothetical protein I7I51_01087 [Histoplasma capsulatum]|uniref:Cytochrome P450 n=1 Tax=Ajellomyces capsulatus TaxID=5037 RepID=A0A8A1MC05_AJECA|nr:hypothetical protein I7I51_01087 [Histoplasma capsulatum]